MPRPRKGGLGGGLGGGRERNWPCGGGGVGGGRWLWGAAEVAFNLGQVGSDVTITFIFNALVKFFHFLQVSFSFLT